MKKILLSFLFIIQYSLLFAQTQQCLNKQIDSLIKIKQSNNFNGVIVIAEEGKIKYFKSNGCSDFSISKPFVINSQFVIGSVSKQITGILVLREYDKHHLNLNDPISKYLFNIKQSWADSVTIHQLLTHTHGIIALDKPLLFKAGSQFQYSQIGYELLAEIIEKTSGMKFSLLSKQFFEENGLSGTTHPDLNDYYKLAKGYVKQPNGSFLIENNSFENYVAAGSFISSAEDLVRLNELLHNKHKLLADSTYKMMTTVQKNAVRDHPLFGATGYGYGITIDTIGHILQYGQTGFAPGYVSMNFYYPEIKVCLIVLENVVVDNNDFKSDFYFHMRVLELFRKDYKNKIGVK